MDNEYIVCVRSDCEGFKVGNKYLLTKFGCVDSLESVWSGYLNGPYDTHLENINNCYGFVKFEKLLN